MQILLATNSYLPQQTPMAEGVDALATELRSAGHDVLVLAPALRSCGPPEQGVVRVSMATVRHDPELRDVPFPRSFHPALVHSFGIFGLGAAALAYAAREQLPLVLTQGARFADYLSITGTLERNMEALLGALETRYAACAAAVVPTHAGIVRDLDRRRVARHVTQAPLPIGRVWWEKPRARPGRRPLKFRQGDFLLALVGRFAAEERTARNLAALGSFLQQSRRGRGVLVGAGPLTPAARALVARPDLVGRVRLLPPRGRGPLRRVLREVDAVLGGRPDAPLTDWTPFAEACGVPVLRDSEAPMTVEAMARQALEIQELTPEARSRIRLERRHRRWEASGPSVVQTHQALYRRLRLQGATAPPEPDSRLLRELLSVTPDVRDFWRHLDLRGLLVESARRAPAPTSLLDRKDHPWTPSLRPTCKKPRRTTREKASGSASRASSPNSISA